jgi:hypothetical protein
MHTRRTIREYLARTNPQGAFARVDSLYRSQIVYRRSLGRGLISDFVSKDAEGRIQPPLSAISHETAKDLERKVSKRLSDDLDAVIECCKRELEDYRLALACHSELRDAELGEAEEAQLRAFIGKGDRYRPSTHQLSQLVTLYLKIDAGIRPPLDTNAKTHYVHSKVLKKTICEALNIPPIVFLSALRIDAYPPTNVRVACALILQAKTRWNIGSVLDLSLEDVEVDKTPFWIQSYKTKTEDETPPVLVETHSEPAGLALLLLRDRLEILKCRGWVLPTETMLWISSKREKGSKKVVQVSNWSAALHRFQKKHNLPRFSFEQVRDQALTILSLTGGGPQIASEAAGHSSLSTITSYFQDVITDRLNAATNLEFQRRWEASIRLRYDSDSVAPGTRLLPIGDGASCVDPSTPPNDAWLEMGSCAGSHCHSGDGCPNRAIVINLDRVEEVKRTSTFYERNWQRLANGNPGAFTKDHLPAMLFNIALRATLKRGPYRHLI